MKPVDKAQRALIAALGTVGTSSLDRLKIVVDQDDLDALIVQLVAVRSAFIIGRWLEARGSQHVLEKTPILKLSHKIAERMHNTPISEIFESAAMIEIATLRDLYEENGLPWPEVLR